MLYILVEIFVNMSYPEILIIVPILRMIYDSLLETLTKIIFFLLRPKLYFYSSTLDISFWLLYNLSYDFIQFFENYTLLSLNL